VLLEVVHGLPQERDLAALLLVLVLDLVELALERSQARQPLRRKDHHRRSDRGHRQHDSGERALDEREEHQRASIHGGGRQVKFLAVPLDFARKLVESGIVQRDEMDRALFAHLSRGVPIVVSLVAAGALSHRTLEDELGRNDAPTMRSVAAVSRLVEQLPAGICRALLAVPVRLDARTGTVDVAAVDPNDPHVPTEFGFHLKAPIRMVRAPLSAIEEALRALETPEPTPAPRASSRPPPARQSRRTPPYLSREAAMAVDAVVPQMRRNNSDMPIPLIRKQTVAPPPMARPPSIAPDFPVAIERSPEASEGEEPAPRTATFSPRAPHAPLPPLDALKEAIRTAQTRDDVIDLLLRGVCTFAGRAGAFVSRRGEYRGWRCNAELASIEVFREVTIPADQPSILATAAATGTYLGPVPRTAAHAELLRVMGYATEVAALPVRVDGVLAMILVLDDLADTMLGTRRAEELALVAGEALARILRERAG
jgi:hypothetical protein